MKHQIQFPLTDENFTLAWDYANNKQLELHKKKIIRKILAFVANIIFFLCVSIITYDALRKIPFEIVVSYLDSIGFAQKMWALVSPIIHHPELHIAWQIIIYLAFAYITTFLMSGVVFLLVWFIYQPNIKKQETQDKATDSKTLWDLLKEIEIRGAKVQNITSTTAAFFYMIEIVAIAGYFFVFLLTNPQLIANAEIITLLLPYLFNQNTGNMIALILLCFFGVYAGFNNLMSTVLKLYYMTKIDESVKLEAEKYYYECNPEAKAEFEEEERILQKAQEITAKRKAEREALLAKINYKNPIYKYIKLGIIAIIIVITIVFASNKLKNVDFEKLLNDITTESTESTESTETNIE